MSSKQPPDTGTYTQIKPDKSGLISGDQIDNLNKALRYIYDQLDAITGRRGNLILGSDLNFSGHKGINAGDPSAPRDIVNKEYADAHYGISGLQNPPSGPPMIGPGSAVFLEGPHSTRPSPIMNAVGSVYYETDRTVNFLNVATAAGSQAWLYNAGAFVAPLASRPVDLGATDTGFLFVDSTAVKQTMYLWIGSAWVTVGGYLQQVTDSATNTPSAAAELVHATTAVATNNFAVRQDFQLQNAAATIVEAGAIDVLWDVATGANEGSRFRFSLRRSGGALTSYVEFNRDLIRINGAIFWLSGTANTGELFHQNTAPRVYTFPDADGSIPYETGVIPFGNLVAGGGGNLLLDSGVALSAVSGTVGLAPLTGGGTPGSISFNSGIATAVVAPT